MLLIKFLNIEIPETSLILKKKFEEDMEYTCKWWKPKAIRRYKNQWNQGKLKEEQLFYWNIIDMTWDLTKKNYLKEVGR